MGLIARLVAQWVKRGAAKPCVSVAGSEVAPHHFEYFAKGQEAFLGGRLDESRLWFGKLEAEDTKLGIAWVFLGNLAKADTTLPDHQRRALECYAQARSLHFDSIEVAINIAATYLDQERAPEALRELLHVQEQGAQIAQWHFHYGRAREMEFDFVPAHAAYDTALRLAPDFTPARVARALVLAWMGHFAECVKELRETAQHGATPLEVARQLTLIGWLIGYSDLVEDSARFVLENDPEDKGAQFGLGNVLLAKGKFAEGWRWFEARVDNPIYPRYKPVLPLWRGEDLGGKHLWIYEEQGFGDEILFARFLPWIAERSGRVTMQCKPELLSLFRSIPGIGLVPHKGRLPAAGMAADFELPLLSLPARLGMADPALLSRLPPVSIAEEQGTRWRQSVVDALAARGVQNESSAARPRIGLAITGAVHRKDNQLRSVPSKCFEALITLECDFFWIQPDSGHINGALQGTVIDLTAGLNDFSDTAALLQQIDLVITVDTAVAHLAATLGMETWVLLPRMRDWRWEIEGHGCLWYPRVRTWRVAENLDWQSLLGEVCLALEARILKGFAATS